MISTLRQTFNAAFSPDTYAAFLAGIDADLPGQLDFRIAETPVFVPKALKDKLIHACDDIVDVLVRPDFKQLTEGAIPAHQRVPNEPSVGPDAHPAFLAIDFAICRDEQTGELTPQLIVLQGFPSLFGFQPYLSEQFRKHYPIPDTVSHLFGVATNAEYLTQLRQLLLGACDPEEVILLEIFPEKQKTRIDFELTRRATGVAPVCLTKIRKEGRNLFYEKDGRQIQIKRIYNRLIFDELANLPNLQTDFRLTDDVDVEWVGHPNWFFRVSKYTLPLIHSPFVPMSYYLNALPAEPLNLSQYVLKPLFSFAGAGVKLHITEADIAAIPDAERGNYLLQRKVKYEPVIQSPDGLVKCEIRMLFMWANDAIDMSNHRPTLITNLARLSRGEMIGVNFNKNKDWVGGTISFMEI